MIRTDLHRKFVFLNIHSNGLWGSSTKKTLFAKNYENCPVLHRKIMSVIPTPGSGSSTNFFTRNDMKCPDLCRKLMFLTPTHLERAGG